MSAPQSPSGLRAALRALRPGLQRAFAFALVAGLLALSATAYMFGAVNWRVSSSGVIGGSPATGRPGVKPRRAA